MLLTSGRSGPSSAELRIPRAVIAAGVGGINQVPSSNPLGKCYFQLILPKLDKRFTGCSRRAVCTKILNPAQKHKAKETGVRQLGSSGGALLTTPKMTSEASLRCPLSIPIEEGTRAGRSLPSTISQDWIKAFGHSTTALQLLLSPLLRQQPRLWGSPGGAPAAWQELDPEAAAGTDRLTPATQRRIHSQSLFHCRAGKWRGKKAESS